jgi:hypothetical protein
MPSAQCGMDNVHRVSSSQWSWINFLKHGGVESGNSLRGDNRDLDEPVGKNRSTAGIQCHNLVSYDLLRCNACILPELDLSEMRRPRWVAGIFDPRTPMEAVSVRT